MKKILNLLLIYIAASCIMFGISVIANAETSGDYTYYVYDGKATITDCSVYIGSNVVVPSELGGYPVVSIGEEAFYFCTRIKNITIPSSIKSISDNAFLSCANIQTVNVDSLDSWLNISFSTAISNPLYYGADLCVDGQIITDITTPTTTTGIKQYSFYNYNKLTTVTMTDNIKTIGTSAFKNCKSLINVKLSDNTSWVGLSAFEGCSNLTTMSMPKASYGTAEASRFGYMFGYTIVNGYYGPGSSEEKIYQGYYYKKYANSGSADFYYYHIPSSLKNITITKSVEDSAFYGCKYFETITIGQDVTKIGEIAFYECAGVKELYYNATDCTDFANNALYIGSANGLSVNIGENVRTIPENFLYYSQGVFNISIPQSVENIGANAFVNTDYYNNESNWKDGLLYVDGWLIGAKDVPSECFIQEGTRGIAASTFGDCTELTSVHFSSSLKFICDNAFDGCTGLTCIHINNLTDWIAIEFSSATSNPSYYCPNVYVNNQMLYNLIIPEGTEKISKYAFYNWGNIAELSIPKSLISIEEDAFANCAIVKTHIPNMETWLNIEFATSESVPIGNNGDLYIGGIIIDSIVIPDSIKTIKSYAFYRIDGLKAVVMGNNVKTIQESAFNYGISKLYFLGTEDMWATIEVCDGNNVIKNITKVFNCYTTTTDKGCFVLNENGELVKYVGTDENLIIPENIATIKEYSLSCQAKTITIPNTVAYIEKAALGGCNNLQALSIPYVGSEKEGTTNTYFGYIFGSDSYYYNYKKVPASLKTVVISDGTTIDSYAFYNCSSIKEIHLPSSLTSVGYNAFYNCDFENGVHILDLSSWCKVDFENQYASPMFPGNNLYLNGMIVDNLVIPEDVTLISEYVFAHCYSLKSIKIGQNIQQIMGSAFFDCAYVDIVNFAGTKTEWETIEKVSGWDNSMGRYTSDCKYDLITASVGIEYSLNTDQASYTAIVIGVVEGEQLTVPAQYEKFPITKITILENLGGKVKLAEEKPEKLGFKFQGWALTEGGSISYKSGDAYLSDDTTTLYAVWKPVPYTTIAITQRTNFDLIDVNLFDLEEGCTVILAIYDDGKLVNLQNDTYNGETVSFIESNDYDTAKVMVWDGLSKLKPLCDVTEQTFESK